MKRSIKLIIMLSLLALLTVFYLLSGKMQKKEKQQSDASYPYYEVTGISAEEITAISYSEGGETLSFKNIGGKWSLAAENPPAIDNSVISSMASAMGNISSANKLGGVSAEKLAEYGLDEPSLKVTVTAGDKSFSYIFGDLNKAVNQYYFACEDDLGTVFTVAPKVKEAFSSSLEELIVHDTLTQIPKDAITSVSFKSGADETLITQIKTPAQDTEYTYSASITKNGKTESLSYSDFEILTSAIYEWNIDSFICYAPDGGTDYGFDSPKTLTVNYTEKQEIDDGDSSGGYFYADKSVTVVLGEADEKGYYYCKTSDSSTLIYKVSTDVFGKFFG